MLRIIQNSASQRAKSYYSTSDYYSQGQELVGFWRGEGARRLGLHGAVDKADWDALCDNQCPGDGSPLTPRRKSERRVGYDFNFHVPKSVSLLYGLTQDERVMDAFRESVEATMLDIEAEAKARVRRAGQNEDHTTGNLVWGEFVHLTARPEQEVPDPHLHAHCFVFNATFDASESRWKAAQLGDIKRDAPYFEAVLHSRLARRLEALGLDTRRTAKGWELGGIDEATLRKFSRRTARIERMAQEKGITDPKIKAGLGAQTRSGKVKELTLAELQSLWRTRLTDQESGAIAAIAHQIGRETIGEDDRAASDAVQRAMEHTFERASVVPERVLLAEAMRQSVGKASRETMEHLTQSQPLVSAHRNGRQLVTTREVLQEESRMLAFAREGRGACRPIDPGFASFKRDWLNSEQRYAVRHVLSSRDRVMIIRGVAGAGKTSALQELREAIEEAGGRVRAFAPSSGASRGVLRREGFDAADTVARLLADPELQKDTAGSLIMIDEAGLLGTKSMRNLFDLAEQMGSRVLLVGDVRQHGSVERGAALRLLENEAGLKAVELQEIQRQKDQYKAAMKDLSAGDVESGFRRLDRLGWIRQVADDDRATAIAAAYVGSLKPGKDTLVVSPTHAEGERITDAIRARLRTQGLLGEDQRPFTRLIPANLTLGQRRDPVSYRPGDVLVFHQNAKGFRRGQRVIVGEGPLPFDHAERFTVYRKGELQLAAGDRIRITKNGSTLDGNHRLNNGDLHTVKSFTAEGDLMLANGWVVPRDYGHLTRGLVVTSYASQGKTFDTVIVGQSSCSFAASSREQFYVSASRGRDQVLVFTDDKHALLKAVNRSDERLGGTELVQGLAAARHRLARERIEGDRTAVLVAASVRAPQREGVVHER